MPKQPENETTNAGPALQSVPTPTPIAPKPPAKSDRRIFRVTITAYRVVDDPGFGLNADSAWTLEGKWQEEINDWITDSMQCGDPLDFFEPVVEIVELVPVEK